MFFGISGYDKNLTVFDFSPLIQMILEGKYAIIYDYLIEKALQKNSCWLCDGIYPKYPSFLHILNQVGEEESYLTCWREGRIKELNVHARFRNKWFII